MLLSFIVIVVLTMFFAEAAIAQPGNGKGKSKNKVEKIKKMKDQAGEEATDFEEKMNNANQGLKADIAKDLY